MTLSISLFVASAASALAVVTSNQVNVTYRRYLQRKATFFIYPVYRYRFLELGRFLDLVIPVESRLGSAPSVQQRALCLLFCRDAVIWKAATLPGCLSAKSAMFIYRFDMNRMDFP